MSKGNGGACRFGPHRLDPAKRVLLRGDDAVPLTPKVFDLLVFLISSRGISRRYVPLCWRPRRCASR
jgi:DNA-binding winged helix-turn-helix (wHTH) protein